MVATTTLSRRADVSHQATHATVLRPLLTTASKTAETGMILGATEQSFIDALLADLAAPDRATRLAARLPDPARKDANGVAQLSQPIHRRHYLVVLEAHCDVPGGPPLDPRKIAGMGMVLRRGAQDGAAGPPWQGRMADGRAARKGWATLPAATPAEAAMGIDPDPDPAFRSLRPRTGHAALDALLTAGDVAPMVEQVLPLYAAPPEVCAAAGRTLLFGLLPLASSEQSDSGPPGPDYVAEAQSDGGALIGHLSGYLKSRPLTQLPNADAELSPAWLDTQPEGTADNTSGTNSLSAFGLLLRQLTIEIDAFGTSKQAQALMTLLDRIKLPTAKDANGNVIDRISAAKFLPQAAAILVGREANPTKLLMPKEWPAVDAALGAQLTQAALACLSARFAQLTPRIGKFAGQQRQYAVRAFIRVNEEIACPPRLVWSNWSTPFRILPWWDGDGPPEQVPPPDLTAPGVLKSMKPGVTFEVPASLANLMRGNPKDLRDGVAPSGGGLTIGWLCSFSIPTITICAFIVLNIFLSLFDLIFSWMSFIKICIPIPKRGGS